MTIRVLCIGNELLAGHTVNSNLAEAGRLLGAEGYAIAAAQTVADDVQAIATAVRTALRETSILVVIGGLGPTCDDLTRPVVADVLAMPLRVDAGVLATIQAYVRGRNVSVPAEALQCQAMVPQGATVLANQVGTAPGLWCETAAGNVVVLLPGPPHEFRTMFTNEVLPRLRRRLPPQTRFATLRVCGMGESTAAARVEAVLRAYPDIAPAYCANPGRVDVRLSANWQNGEVLEAAAAHVRQELGDAVLPSAAATLAEAIGLLLRQRNWTLATAESCTGGGIAAAITDVPGCSAYFHGGLVTYCNAWKTNYLGVPGELLATHGAVSAETARAMVQGLVTRTGTSCGIAVTGIAGPDGGSADKPVGLVYIGTATPQTIQVQPYQFPGDRATVRLRTVTTALNQLRLQLSVPGTEP